MKAHLSHIGLLVTDLGKAREFYGNILGLHEIERPPFLIKGLWYDLGAFELHLMLHENAHPPSIHPLNPTVQPHFALAMSQEDINRTLEKLEKAGIELVKEPKKSPTGVWQAFFCDFDKNMIEVNDEARV